MQSKWGHPCWSAKSGTGRKRPWVFKGQDVEIFRGCSLGNSELDEEAISLLVLLSVDLAAIKGGGGGD